MSNKNDRREAARKQAERLTKQSSADNRTRNILIAIVAAVVVLLVVAGVMIFQASQKTLLSDFEGATPEVTDSNGGVSFGEGGEAGSSNSGPEVQVYVDFMCPVCGSFEEVNGDDLRELAENGTATVVYHPVNFLDRLSQGTEFSSRAASAFVTVADEAPEAALDFMSAMFDQQPEENSSGLTDEEMADIAVDAGVPQDVADSFDEVTYGDWAQVATDQASRDGVGGTPTVVIDGDEVDPEQVNWSQPGMLAEHIEDLAG